jgi:hypothetical protein
MAKVTKKLGNALRDVKRVGNNISLQDILETICDVSYVKEYYYEKFESSVKSYWVYNHMCGDTLVGLTAIYMDDELIGMSTQHNRKSDIEYKFLSVDALHRITKFALECVENHSNLAYELIIDRGALEIDITYDE